MNTTEKRFESDIESFFLSPAGGYAHCEDSYDPKLGLNKDTLIRFIQDSGNTRDGLKPLKKSPL